MAALGEFREMSSDLLRTLKRTGFSDADIAAVHGVGRGAGASAARSRRGSLPSYKRIDTCAAEFESFTPYMYGTLRARCARPTRRRRRRSIILGSGPNRIGQGIEFDYCCCHAVFGFREEGFETVMVNCNPETVSTDYDTADRLYFEPLTFEDVMAIIERERTAGGERVLRRAVRRPDAAEAGAGAAGGGRRRSSARRPIRSISPKTAGASRSCSGTSACRSRPAAPRSRARRRARWPSGSAIPSSCVRRTCSADAGWRSCSTPARSTAT